MTAQQLFTWAGGPIREPLALGFRLLLALLLSGVVAGLGYRRHSLSESGVAGAMIVGTIVFTLGGWVWGLLLIAFFATSSALSHFRAPQKQALADRFAKTGRRDLAQALANGGLGAALALLLPLSGYAQPLLLFAFAGAMAAVNADTWATELGVLSARKPRLITTGEAVEPGSSGAVSWLGLAAAFAGAWLIGFLALAFQVMQGWLTHTPQSARLAWLPLAVAVGGFAGALVDTLLGATVQATYYCLQCGVETEQPVHRCGRQPIFLRGWHWLDNDWVNLLSSLVGALVAAGLGWLVLYL